MRIIIAQLCLALGLSTAAAAAPLPEFPMLQERYYPQDDAGIRARMDAGEGYATLRIALQTQCAANDDPAGRARRTTRSAQAIAAPP
ncbi:hypothetical protein [Candidatus Viadribacter manganicus]|uniref:UrcA family protein n=1 Tax=Candidatus Viadribacter manganicus TaxID=1759059 RepID=A0A1B1AII6_9PROT|nr:hypothetical protein [Candidatus Viadribacter manganicus]ANP46330.1 hypothetical protein ATE48_10590 [Candidatus Viadribacter manganicus]